MKKVMVLGAGGMAGHMISMYFKTLPKMYEVIDVCHSKKMDDDSIALDVRNLSLVNKLIDNINPDIIVNCIGILNKVADKKAADTIFINSYFPRYIERYCKDRYIKIIHLSTDCVFSGLEGNYSEDSYTDGEDLYAKTKILGEINNDKDLTVRTSIIGPELKQNGIGLFHWFMNQSESIKGYSKVIWSGVTTLQLAICLDKMIRSNITGIYHLAPEESISKYELLNSIAKVFNKDLIIEKYDSVICNKTLITIRKELVCNIPSYEEMLVEMKKWMVSNCDIYKAIYDIRSS